MRESCREIVTMCPADSKRRPRCCRGLICRGCPGKLWRQPLAFLYSLSISSMSARNCTSRDRLAFFFDADRIDRDERRRRPGVGHGGSLPRRPPASRMIRGDRERDLLTLRCPRSMRLASSISPSRVSSGTVPISRKYMRTGSLVLSPKSCARSSSANSSPSSSFLVELELRFLENFDTGGVEIRQADHRVPARSRYRREEVR